MDRLGFLLITNLWLSIASAETHSLRYLFTTDSSLGAGSPSYQAVSHLDEEQIARYDSDTRSVVLLQPWMKTHINPQHWRNQTQIAQYYESRQREIIKDLEKHFNHTKDGTNRFVLQVRFWCLLSGDDSISGYEEFAVNGNDFIVLDTFMSEYIAVVDKAKKLANVWNNREFSAVKQKGYMEQECKTWFKIYLHHMEKTLKPVRPELKVWGRRQSDGATRLQCLVYGFHPRAVDVRWRKNGVDHVSSYEMTPILPHPDGTYQVRVDVEVPTTETDPYSCHVEHSSLEDILVRTAQNHAEANVGKWSGRIGLYITFVLVLLLILGFWIKISLSGRDQYAHAGQEVRDDIHS